MQNEQTNISVSKIEKEENELKGFIEGEIKTLSNEKTGVLNLILEDTFSKPTSAKDMTINSTILLELPPRWSELINGIVDLNDLVSIYCATVKKNDRIDIPHDFKLTINSKSSISIQTKEGTVTIDQETINSKKLVWRGKKRKIKEKIVNNPKIVTPKYSYTKLKDVKEGDIYNCFGFVENYSNPRSGYYTNMTLTIRDETGPLNLLIQAKDKSQLIDVKQIGDVVRVHRLKVIKYLGKLQGNESPGCDFYLSPIDSINIEIPKSKTFTELDIERIKELKVYSKKYLQKNSLKNQFTCTVSTIQPLKYVDIIGRITMATKLSFGYVIHFNDGTENDKLGSSLEVQATSSHLQDVIAEIQKRLNMKKTVFVKLRNIFCVHSFAEVRTVDNSSIGFLPSFCLDVKNLNELRTKIVTSTKFSKAPSSISQVLECQERNAKFKIIVNVIDSYPSNSNEFIILSCPQCNQELNRSICKKCNIEGKYVFCFKLLLKDKTGEMTTYIFDKQAVNRIHFELIFKGTFFWNQSFRIER
eukprot:gene4602-7984_t